MVLRAVALCLALLIGIGVIIPLATDSAEAGPRHHKKKKRSWRGVKKYSKRWWQLYRAQERRKKVLNARSRALRLKQLRLAADDSAASTVAAQTATAPVKKAAAPAAVLPSGKPAPAGWSTAQATPAEVHFRVDDSAGSQVGSASITVVGPAMTEARSTNPNTVGGVSTSSLRRDVIDRMIRENGWVVNDYKKDIGGQPVYVVVAQSQGRNGALTSRVFYFTEVDGRIYNVATNSPANEAERLAEESEKVIASLKARVRPTERASTKN